MHGVDHLCWEWATKGLERASWAWEDQLRPGEGTLCPAKVTCAQVGWLYLGRVTLPGESNLCLGNIFTLGGRLVLKESHLCPGRTPCLWRG